MIVAQPLLPIHRLKRLVELDPPPSKTPTTMHFLGIFQVYFEDAAFFILDAAANMPVSSTWIYLPNELMGSVTSTVLDLMAQIYVRPIGLQ